MNAPAGTRPPRRICLVISSLQPGGAERSMSSLANQWAERGDEVLLITFQDASEPPFFTLHPAIRLRPLSLATKAKGTAGALLRTLRRVRALRRELRRFRPDVVLSFIDSTNVVTLLAGLGLGLAVVVAERSVAAEHPLGHRWDVLRRRLYPLARTLVVQTAEAREWWAARVRVPLAVIPNPAYPPPPDDGGSRSAAAEVVVAMGRLGVEKGFDCLLRAFARVAPRFPSWRLEIWGEGSERSALEALVAELGLAERVRLPGITTRPHEVLRAAGLFVLSSRYEGFPNVLCEAMACGLPVVSFDCPSGPRAILRHDVDGVLVPAGDEEALARALEELLGAPEKRRALGRRAVEVTERFAPERILQRWDEVLSNPR